MSEKKSIGVGLISVGVMGRLHGRAYLQAPQFFPELPRRPELIIAADPDPRSKAYATDALGFRRVTDDYRELLNDPEVEVVSICSPPFLHREIALAAIDAGKHFWIEKPMGRGAQESRDIAQGAEAANLITGVGFNYRHAPAIAEARRLIRSGALGRITNLQLRMITSYASDPEGPFTWRYEVEQAGSGALGDVLSHGFDLAQYLIAPITAVTAVTEKFIPQRALPSGGMRDVENEDYAAVTARFEDGVVGILETTRVAVGPHAEYIVEVYGTKGSLRWNFDRMNQLELADDGIGYRTIMTPVSYGEFARFQPNAGPGIGFNDLKTIEAALFLRSVAEKTQLAPSAADGWSAAEIVDASIRSARSGRWVDVPAVTGPTTTQA